MSVTSYLDREWIPSRRLYTGDGVVEAVDVLYIIQAKARQFLSQSLQHES